MIWLKKQLKLGHEVCVVAQVAYVRVAERQVIAFYSFIHRIAIVQHNDEFPALVAVLQGCFSQFQAPIQELIVCSSNEPCNQRLDGFGNARRCSTMLVDNATMTFCELSSPPFVDVEDAWDPEGESWSIIR